MIKGETKSGFKFEIDERVLKDWRVIRLVAKIEKNENPMDTVEYIENVGNKILTEKGFNKLLKHIEKQNDGFCLIDDVGNEIADIFAQINSKNLMPSSTS
ncbi:MAG: hypothetical protein MJZ34_13560 [Paludibacteraceae bacterium]|nr:hypothetical protein [Paludibacteraceae bacterium]